MSITSGEQTIWFPGIYEGRTEDEEYTQVVARLDEEALVKLVQKRAQEDGEWAIEQGLVGENEGRMRWMMGYVCAERNIKQCVAHVYNDAMQEQRSVDWLCRELANASKWALGTPGE